MRRSLIIVAASALLVSSCNTYTGAGAYTGSSLGGILGSAIGGIAGGPRGDDIGTLIGMASGAMVGAAVGAQADKKQQEEMAWYRGQRSESSYRQRVQSAEPSRRGNTPSARSYNQSSSVDANSLQDLDSGFDPSGSGDDRLYDFQGSDYTSDYSAGQPTTTLPATSSASRMTAGRTFAPSIEIRNARFVDENRDNAINRGELCKVIFEVYNNGQQPIFDVVPMVVEASGNKHLALSPSMHVEQIAPGRGIRYTALVKADNKLKDGMARICVSVMQGGKNISQVSEFSVPTKR